MHDPKLTDMDCFVCIETVFGFFLFFIYFFSADNLWRWNNDGGAMEEEIEREKRRERCQILLDLEIGLEGNKYG